MSDNASSIESVFYIDEPELIISTPEIDIGQLSSESSSFSNTVTVTVNTVGAGFHLIMNRVSDLSNGTDTIPSSDGTYGY